MSVQVEPYQLRFLASRLSAGSQELLLKANRLESIMSDLVRGSWKGEAAHAFAIKCEMMKSYADTFASSGKWPEDIQIPRHSNVLNTDGSINWSEVPNGGYILNKNGDAIKETFVPKRGDIIDRYGPPNGRYTSPVIDGKPYNYEQRSLPYVEDVTKYHQYEVIGDFSRLEEAVSKSVDVKLKMKVEAYIERYYNGDYSKVVTYRGGIAEGFESPGGGIQYELPLPVEWLEGLGMLKEL